jgi:hypothetical protein
MRISHVMATVAGFLLGGAVCFGESDNAETTISETADPTSIVSPEVERTPHDDPWDSRRYWYCNAAPFRWVGHWDRRDYDAFGRNYWRVHERAERKCERFHRRCLVWCERRHQWEWDGGLPGPDMNE